MLDLDAGLIAGVLPVFHKPRAYGLARRRGTQDPVDHTHREFTVFDQPGIGVEDLAWIHRDQFVHYVQLAHALGDSRDWPGLRQDLLRVLTVAFGLDAETGGGLTPRQQRALRVLDEIRRQHNPASSWPRSSRRSGADAMTSGPTSPELGRDIDLSPEARRRSHPADPEGDSLLEHAEQEAAAMRLKDLPPTLSVEQAG